MRARSEIAEEVWESDAESNGDETIRLLQLEVLLDIRDLLQGLQPPTYTIAQPEVKTDDKGLHRKD